MKTLFLKLYLLALPLLGAAFSLRLAAQEAAPGSHPPAERAVSTAGAGAASSQGFLYGKVTTTEGTAYQGRLRWGGEEASWGDFFNSVKRDRPYEKDIPREHRRRRKEIEILGVPIGISVDLDSDRHLVARFGDVVRLDREGARGSDATLVMKTGTKHRIRGGSNDVEGTVTVWDAGAGEVEIDWDSIRSVELQPVPPGLEVAERRLYGTVATTAGTLHGFLQWDQDECLGSDKLDGESGGAKLSLEMGNLRSIEKVGRRSKVELRDGRKMTLAGSNDVDDDNRGLFVDDPRYGRVLVPWSAFRRVDFEPAPGSGPGYAEYRHGRILHGKVVTKGGAAYAGRLVYDVDEGETWEMLDGSQRGLDYSIPFALVRSITPEGKDASRVRLASGEELVLEDSADVDSDNAGMLVFGGEGKARYVPWKEVRRVELEER